MATPAPPPAPGPQKKAPAEPPAEDAVPSVMNDGDVLEVYNQRNEFHIAVGVSGLLHVLVAVGLIFLAQLATAGIDKSSPPLEAREVTDIPDFDPGRDRDMGREIAGSGSQGSGGDPLADDAPDVPTVPDKTVAPLPDVIPPTTPDLPEAKAPLPNPNFKEPPPRPRGTGTQAGRG